MKLVGCRIWNSVIFVSLFIVANDIVFNSIGKHIMLRSCLSFTYKTTIARRTGQSQQSFRTILEAKSSPRKTNPRSRNYTRSQKSLTDDSSSSFAAMPKQKKGPNFYAVAVGRNTGIYSTWDECNSQVNGFKGGRFKKFSTVEEAESFIASYSNANQGASAAAAVEAETSQVAASTKKKRPRVVASKKPEESKSGNANNPIHIESPVAAATNSRKEESTADDTDETGTRKPHKLYFHVMFDGGSRGNPHGDAGSGTYILTRKFYSVGESTDKKSGKTEITRSTDHIRTYLGRGLLTNNQAEYTGLVTGLKKISEALTKMSPRANSLRDVVVFVQGDSDLIVKQMNGIYACKSPKLKSYHRDAREFVGTIQKRCKTLGATCQITFEHVYREDNKIADGLANEAMDAKRSWVTSKGDDDNEKGGAIEV